MVVSPSSTSQASVSGPPTEGAMDPLTPTAAPPSFEGAPTSNRVYSNNASDSNQENVPTKFVTAPGYVVPAPSFSYNVLPNVYRNSGSSEYSSSSPVTKSNSPSSSTFIQRHVPGISASAAPSFSYNISHVSGPSGQQIQPRMPIGPIHVHSQGGMNTPSPAASLQPPVPEQSPCPAQIMQSQVPSPAGFPKGFSSNSANFSSSGNPQSTQKDQSFKSNSTADVPQEACTASPTSLPPSVSQPAHTSGSASSAPNFGPPSFLARAVPPYQVPPGLPQTPVTPGPPGLGRPVLLRPMGPTALPSNPALQQQNYTPYSSAPPIWLQPQQIGGLPRPPPPLLARPPALPGLFSLPSHGMQLPSVPLPNSQPPGVIPVGASGGPSTLSSASANQSMISSTMEPELPPGIDNSKHVNDVSIKDRVPAREQLDVWTAHRTETGAVYYYNAFTRESTYEKPAGFKGELEKVAAQPTPVSWERLASTDWVLVSTNDGKRYYYNTKTKLSSWQIPAEVTELKKKQDDDEVLNEQSMSVTNTNILTEKGSAPPISLSAPAVNTGGRDATALRTPIVPGSSSALDLIKRKLQDSGAPSTSLPVSALSGAVALSELNGSRVAEAVATGTENENSKDKNKDADGDGNMSDSSTDSEDVDSGPTKEERIIQFKEMLKERGVAPFSKWEKELPKIVFDPRFKAIPSYSARRSLFEHYVRTRAEEERKEKRAAQKAAIEVFRQLLEEAKEDIDHNTNYHSFKKKWGHDPRFQSLDRKEREVLLNERVLPLKKAVQEKAQAIRAAAASNFKSMLREKGDVTTSSRWSKVKDSLRNDPRYKTVEHNDRELLFNEYISELKSAEEETERAVNAKREEEEKLKERERAFRKRKEREEQEVERVRTKARRKEAVESYQALLVETIKDPQASWMESKPKLEKDPQERATRHHLDQSDLEKLFREHVKMLHERCARDFRALLAEVITTEAALQETEDGKTVFTSWSTAKNLLKPDPRYTKMPRKERESLWRRHVDEMQRRQKLAVNKEAEKHTTEAKSRTAVDSEKYRSGSSRIHERR